MSPLAHCGILRALERVQPDHRSIRPIRLFAELGYTITFRRSGWWECLLACGAERWFGCGTSRRLAFEDAVGKSLPSHAARQLFEARLQASRDRSRAEISRDSGARAGPLTYALRTEDSVSAASALPTDDSASATSSARTADPESAASELATSPAQSSTIREPDAVPSTLAAPRSARDPLGFDVRPASQVRAPKLPFAEARARFAELDYDIDGALEEAGLLEPERQRLLLLSWIARARAVEAECPQAHDLTHAVARRLSRLAKVWWPGSVRALGIHSSPSESAAEISGGAALEFHSWSEVAAGAERALEENEDLDEDRLDAHGWADAAALAPAHPRPDVELAEVVAQIERFTSAVVRPSEEDDAVPAFAVGHEPWRVDVPLLATLARRLRWLRGATSDLELWGAAIGRLRWVSATLRARGDAIAHVLDPRYTPAGSWAQELRYDPDKKRRQKARKALISATGAPKPEWATAELDSWLRQALELGDMLPSERIAQVLEEQGVVDSVLRMDARTFSDRRSHRTRLEAIQRHLRGDLFLIASAPTSAAGDEDDESTGPSYFDRMLEPILGFTRGKHVLFVSNRNDPTIDERLRELFAFEEVDHCEVKSSNVAAQAKRVEQGRYDMVLAATGFLSHSTDSVFRDAARRALIPHVRVNKGRPLSVALALARELGIRAPTGSPGTSI